MEGGGKDITETKRVFTETGGVLVKKKRMREELWGGSPQQKCECPASSVGTQFRSEQRLQRLIKGTNIL